MSSPPYKHAAPKSQPYPEKYPVQALQLQELFPAWSNDDLQSVLAEVGGDVDLAATRISEGFVQQWGSVTRKKDKKPPAVSHPQTKESSSGTSDFRGRGGRVGRVGPGRGGSGGSRPRGTSRGGHPGANGHFSRPNNSPGLSPSAGWADPTATPDDPDKVSVGDGGTWSNKQDAVTATWNDPPSQETPTWVTPNWGETGIDGSPSLASKPPSKPPKNPATSKLSWAQVARPQEKPTAPSPVPVPATVSLPSPVSTPPPVHQLQPESEAEPEPESQQQQPGWEEPTTIQPHTWDDEPHAKPIPSNVWLSSPENMQEYQASREEEISEPPIPAPMPEPVPSGPPAQLQSPPQNVKTELASPPKPITQVRVAATSHRNSARYKTIDQPVVMPSSFGSGIEKVGMQFGSLSLGGESLFDSAPPELPAESPSRGTESPPPEPTQAQRPPTPRLQAHSEPPLVPSPVIQAPHNPTPTLFQQPQTHPMPHVPHPQQPLQASVSQPAVPVPPQAPSHAASAASPIQPFAQQSMSQQQGLATHHLQQQHPPSQSQVHSQYAQHGLPTHIDPTQNQTPHAPQHIPSSSQPQQNANAHSTYFRQAEAPYFHTPTPPAGQVQDSPYGAFGPLGQQGQHQAQAQHLGGFGGGEYGYGDNQRGFYESYAQQSGFGNRNVLGHDDVKGLPPQQQPPAGAGLPPSNAQASQQHPPATQGAGQPQPGAGQGPQQGYPPPVPYYYPYPQNQYYGAPYNSYGVPQPFVKYPAMFQPGPPGPGSAPSPAAKQAPNVQPQSNPYGQGLYTQHPSASYDELGYQHHAQQQQQHNLTHGQGVTANIPSEYAKQPLYGGHNAQGIQGFIGLGQNAGPSSGPPIGQRTGGSPETAYKPYAPVGVKDVGTGVGVGQPGVGQVPQGRAGVQPQPQHNPGAFYGTNRFASNTAAGPQGQQGQQHQNQGQAPQGHIGYPQGGNDGNFYYQARQQGYWQ